jgi:2-phospho-L-lactate guanylyltransferase
VLDAAEGCKTVVVSDDQAVLDWANGRADLALLQPQPGLNEALRFTSVYLRDSCAAQRLLICHSDLSQPGAMREILDIDRSVIAPDRAGLGTNLLSVDITTEFRFAYGPGSYARHAAALRATGRGPTLHLWNSTWSNDVDTPDDLQRLKLI